MGLKLANNAVSTLAAGISSGATSLTLQTGHGARFPTLAAGDWFPVTGEKSDGSLEIMRCTARSGDVLTVTRAQEGTTALAFDAGDVVELRFTEAVFFDLKTNSIVQRSAQAAAGTAIDFTNVPSWVKRITVEISGVSTNGTSPLQVQIGTTGGIESSGYAGAASTFGAGSGTSAMSTGFRLSDNSASANSVSGTVTLMNQSGNIWVESGTIGNSAALNLGISGGVKTLSGVLDRIRLTTVNGTDTFDAGSVNITYEG